MRWWQSGDNRRGLSGATVVFLLMVAMPLGCASAPKQDHPDAPARLEQNTPEPFFSPPEGFADIKEWAAEPTTPAMLGQLVERLLLYRSERASRLARSANADREAAYNTYVPDPSGDFWTNLGRALNSGSSRRASRRAASAVEELDIAWHGFLMDVLGIAPGVLDFDGRAVALGLSPEEVQPYWALFQIVQAAQE